jgi:hypothetical protein
MVARHYACRKARKCDREGICWRPVFTFFLNVNNNALSINVYTTEILTGAGMLDWESVPLVIGPPRLP